jgi:RNA polymerase sigma-70 factor (ECF subfamily)
MHPSSTDSSCIVESLERPEAFGELFDRHAPAVFRYVRARLGLDADDAVGDTFIAAFRARHRFDSTLGDSALPWLLGIATNVIAKRRDMERRWLRPIPAMPLHETDDVDAANDRLDGERIAPWLAVALNQLRARDRDALVLHVVGDLSVEDVALALGVPPGTIKSRLHRARRILAAQLEVYR